MWDHRREKRKAKGEGTKKQECWIWLKPWLAYIKILWFEGAAADKKCSTTYSFFLSAELRSEFPSALTVKAFCNMKNTNLDGLSSSWPCKFLCEAMRSHHAIKQLLLYHEKFNDIRRCSINIPTCEGQIEESGHTLSVWTNAAFPLDSKFSMMSQYCGFIFMLLCTLLCLISVVVDTACLFSILASPLSTLSRLQGVQLHCACKHSVWMAVETFTTV